MIALALVLVVAGQVGGPLRPVPPRDPETQIDHGVRARADPVVRLISLAAAEQGSPLICTGTRIVLNGVRGVLTAAHCLYQPTAAGALGPRWTDLMVEGGPWLNLSRAFVSTAFAKCAHRGATAQTCIERDLAPDVAFIPSAGRGDAWAVCDAEPSDRRAVVLGYGYDQESLPNSLLLGKFTVEPPSTRSVLWIGRGAQQQMVNQGDSGGPALLAAGWAHRREGQPAVCWVVSGYVDAPLMRRTARLIAAWNLHPTLDSPP